MESHEQSIRVRDAINKVILSLMNPSFKITNGGQALLAIEEGLKRMNKALYPYSDIADDRIIDFLVYQLYIKKDSRWRITIIDLFGNQAIEKYRQQFMSETGKSGINYYIDQWLSGAGLTRSKLTKMIAPKKPHKMNKFIYLEADELIKARFYNSQEGYMLCQRSTTGWAPRSSYCRDCSYAQQCYESTDKRFPELVRLRQKDYNGKEK